MSQLHFAGLTQDGRTMLVLDERGEQHQLTVDERVKAAARGDAARLGQLELTIEATLRPAEIQARVRSGQSPEEVARDASMPVEKVLRFAGTVMAERTMFAERAQADRLRGTGRADGQPLGELVGERLAERAVQAATWDAWRDKDGQWVISLRWGTGKKAGRARFRYDPQARHSVVDDDAARDLLDPPAPTAAVAGTPVPADEEITTDAPFSLDAEPEPALDDPAAVPLDEPAAVRTEETRLSRPFSLIRSTVAKPAAEPAPAPQAVEHTDEPVEQRAAAGDGTTPRGRHPKIPAWDDIVFGARKNG